MARVIEDLKCPFCGKTDIEYGLALCATCHADIRYDVEERQSGVPDDLKVFDALEKRSQKAQRDYDLAVWPFSIFALKRMTKAVHGMETLLASVQEKANAEVDRRLARGDTFSVATFSRGERSIQVKTYIPANPNVQVDYDVVIVSDGGKKANVTQAVKAITRSGMMASIKLVESIPVVILSGVTASDAETAKQTLEAAGATVEVR